MLQLDFLDDLRRMNIRQVRIYQLFYFESLLILTVCQNLNRQV